jgi:phospholipase C
MRKIIYILCIGGVSFLCGCSGSAGNSFNSDSSGSGGSGSTPVTYQLTVQSSGTGGGAVTSSPAGINCGTTCQYTFPAGTVVTLTNAPGSTSAFGGWAGGCSGMGACSVTIDANTTVSATFSAAPATYQLTVQSSGTGAGAITSSPAGISCGTTCQGTFPAGTVVTLTEAPGSTSTFGGWTGGCSGTGACSVTINANTAVSATFNAAPATYQLTIQSSGTGGGTITSSPAGVNCGTTCQGTFPAGTVVTLTDAPGSTSTFGGWAGGCSGTGACSVTMNANTTVSATFSAATYQLTVQSSGTGGGTITSSPTGINCGTTCQTTFPSGTVVALTEAPGSTSTFGGWTSGCSGTGACSVTMNANTTVSATFSAVTGVALINHVVILVQENRSLDNYLGQLRQYWAQNGYPDQSFDGLPQFNPTSGAAPLQGPAPSIQGCNPSDPAPSDCVIDPSNPVTSFHLNTMCTENTSPTWDEAHNDWNPKDNVGNSPAALNGFVYTAAYDGRALDFYDSDGIRAMGYYDGNDLNFLYFMASNFATSDRWFQPAMSRTNINREYLLGATSGGYVYPNGTDAADTPLLNSETIFQDMQNAGISWKIYVDPQDTGCTPPYTASCLMTRSYLQNFTYAQTVINQFPQNIQPISQYFTDLKNGTLPQVAEIEPASDAGLDEHGTDLDSEPPVNVQLGEAYVESLITALMNSSSWSSSALFWTYDESGGLYDHVSPQPMPSPDGIKPLDLMAGDICTKSTGPTCDFVWTGYRIPLVVVSPYAKQNYVSHTVADYTAMLKFIETRFNLPPLNKRDAAQMDMTEFFDFNNPPSMAPTPPAQNTSGACYLDHLP